jgi:hypothetical protein
METMSTCKDCVASLFGLCREEYCYAERVALIERATRAADQLGHQLTEFAKIEKHPVWRAECTRCGLQVTVRLDPELKTIVWDNGADLAPEFLHDRLLVPAEPGDEAEH